PEIRRARPPDRGPDLGEVPHRLRQPVFPVEVEETVVVAEGPHVAWPGAPDRVERLLAPVDVPHVAVPADRHAGELLRGGGATANDPHVIGRRAPDAAPVVTLPVEAWNQRPVGAIPAQHDGVVADGIDVVRAGAPDGAQGATHPAGALRPRLAVPVN